MKEEQSKISFSLDDGSTEEFFVLEQTVISGKTYLLVANEEDQCLILAETGSEGQDVTFEPVEDETELTAVAAVFERLLDETDIELS